MWLVEWCGHGCFPLLFVEPVLPFLEEHVLPFVEMLGHVDGVERE